MFYMIVSSKTVFLMCSQGEIGTHRLSIQNPEVDTVFQCSFGDRVCICYTYSHCVEEGFLLYFHMIEFLDSGSESAR